jgi:hypothetical protein
VRFRGSRRARDSVYGQCRPGCRREVSRESTILSDIVRDYGPSAPPAGKILALLDRGAPRDLYDVASMAGGWSRMTRICSVRCSSMFVALSGVLDRAVTAYAVPHRRTPSQAGLDEQLVPVPRGGERPNQAALTASITPLVSRLVTLSEAEREYVEQIKWGEFHPELVVKNRPELLERLRRHPGLLTRFPAGDGGRAIGLGDDGRQIVDGQAAHHAGEGRPRGLEALEEGGASRCCLRRGGLPR